MPKYIIPQREKRDLTPEEVLSDAYGEIAARFEKPINQRNFFIFGTLLVLGVTVVAARVLWLAVWQHRVSAAVAEKNHTRVVLLPAQRGVVYDRAGHALLQNVPTLDLITDPTELPRGERARTELAGRFSVFIHTPSTDAQALQAKITSTATKSMLLAEYLTPTAAIAFAAREAEFPGVVLRATASRRYTTGEAFYHVLGHVGRATPEDVDAGYAPTDLTGKSGVELSYEGVLKGMPGKEVLEVDARGVVRRKVSRDEAVEGGHLVLTIDETLQQYAYDALMQTLRAYHSPGGAVVAIDPRDGSVRALASAPSVDGNVFTGGISNAAYQKILNDEQHPFFNRATGARYPSGSTIKPFMGVAALQEVVVTPSTIIEDRGEITVPDIYNLQHVYTFHGYAALGPVNILSAIALSSDIYFYTVGGGYGGIKGLGIERIAAYLGNFGFGGKLGIDLPGENEGLVPTPAYKESERHEKWRIGDTYNVSIGQGDMGVTPLQLAVATAAIANGGTLWQPRVVDRVVDGDFRVLRQNPPHAIRSSFIASEHLDVIRRAMRGTVTWGTAKALQDLPVAAAAKTGTAQTGSRSRHHALVTVFAPFEKPEIVLAVVVEKAGEGSDVAVPLARAILTKYFASL